MTGGTVTLSLAPRRDGTYPAGASISLIANPVLSSIPASWAGVDSFEGNLALVQMDTVRFAFALMAAPTPTPSVVVNVSGSITRTTTWGPGFSYLVSGDFTIPEGVTLSVAAGTSVKFLGGSLQVAGTLIAEGTPANPITFTSDSQWEGIQLLDTSSNSRIVHSIIEKVTGAAVDTGSGPLTLEDSIIRLSNLGLWVRSSRTSLVRNEIYSNDVGVLAGTSNNVNLFQNTIRDNGVGVKIQGPRAPLVLNQNNIVGNAQYNLQLVTSGVFNVTATGNWWGTADEERIEGSIFDGNEESGLVSVVFKPFATGPISDAP